MSAIKYYDLNKYTPLLTGRLINFDAVVASIHNMLTIRQRARLFHPEGFDLNDLLFQNADQDLILFRLQNQIIRLLASEPRIKLNNGTGDMLRFEPAEHLLHITLDLSVVGIPERQVFTGAIPLTRELNRTVMDSRNG